MCGIIAAFGTNAHSFIKDNMIKLNHRGPDGFSIYYENDVAIGFSRLSINDTTDNGMQPRELGAFVTLVNGEIYNHQQLKSKHNYEYESACDTNIIPYLWRDLGVSIIDELDGFYTGIIWNKETKNLYTICDYVGKKPLFIVRYENLVIISSELKTIPLVDNFQRISKGVSQIDAATGEVKVISKHSFFYPAKKNYLHKLLVQNTLQDAVFKRIPKDGQKYGVFLSGGLDSSIIASIVNNNRINNDVKYYVLGNPGCSTDSKAAKKVIDFLCIKNFQFVNIPETEDEIKCVIEKVVYATESYNPSIISNGIGTFLLSEIARKDGIKVILSGEGADEMFFGYHKLMKEPGWKDVQNKLIQDMCFTELRRIDLTAMAHSIEIRCPFLDKKIYEITKNMEYDDFFEMINNKIINKNILRKAFSESLPDFIVNRTKTSLDVGTGLRKLVVEFLKKDGMTEKEHLKMIWRRAFPCFTNENDSYFHSYPVFDEAISQRGAKHL